MTPETRRQLAAPDSALLVRLGERQYGLPLASVERVLPMAFIASLPDSGDGLMGVLNLHGDVLPVVDPHPRVGLQSPRVGAEHRLILLRANSAFLIWVDEAEEVVSVRPEELSAVPAQHASPVVACVMRLGGAIVPMLAPAALEPRGSVR
jgi:chemotaxis signal transduction protein